MPTGDAGQRTLFAEPTAPEAARAIPPGKGPSGHSKARIAKGPKPMDPSLPREVIQVPAPDLKDLICPVTGQPRQPGFIEQLEVLARRAPEYYVKRYERTVFVSPEKTAPAYSPWPADIHLLSPPNRQTTNPLLLNLTDTTAGTWPR